MFRLSRRLGGRMLRFAETPSAEVGANPLYLKFVSPTSVVADKVVHQVIVPTVTGDLGVMSSHVPTIAQIRPGLVVVQEKENDATEKYFVPGGFAVMAEDSSLSVTVSEAIPLDDIDEGVVNEQLSALTSELNGVSDEVKKAELQIGIDVYEAMQYAITQKV